VAQAEYCHNLIFHRAAALERLFGRLLDGNRAIGQPQRLAVIFGREHFRPDTRTGQTTVKVTTLKTPVLNTGFRSTSLKQYVKGHTLLRTETSCYQLRDRRQLSEGVGIAAQLPCPPGLRQSANRIGANLGLGAVSFSGRGGPQPESPLFRG
jgi:hypothetical protein